MRNPAKRMRFSTSKMRRSHETSRLRLLLSGPTTPFGWAISGVVSVAVVVILGRQK